MRDLARRKGLGRPRARPGALLPFFRHALSTDPRGFQVAVQRGKVVAFAITILRGKTHFLAMFFALPGKQSRGIGRRLLAAAFEEPRPPRGAVRCVIASPDHRAQALYLKFGMFPRSLCYIIAGEMAGEAPRSRIELRPVGPAGRASRAALELAARFDLQFRGARRDVDHRYLLTVGKGGRLYEARFGGRSVGYIVVRTAGGIGPGAVTDARFGKDLVAAAMARARETGSKRLVIWAPGLNEGSMEAAFEAGLKIEGLTVWMAGKEIGDLTRYVPANGVLF